MPVGAVTNRVTDDTTRTTAAEAAGRRSGGRARQPLLIAVSFVSRHMIPPLWPPVLCRLKAACPGLVAAAVSLHSPLPGPEIGPILPSHPGASQRRPEVRRNAEGARPAHDGRASHRVRGQA